MREYVLVTTADVAAEHLWAVAADLPNWSAWHPPVVPSGPLWATPSGRGNAPARVTVREARPPTRLVAVATRFMARVRLIYEFEPVPRGTRVRVTVQLHGPLSFAYHRSFDRHLQQTFSTLASRLIERARRVGSPPRPLGHAARESGTPAPPLTA